MRAETKRDEDQEGNAAVAANHQPPPTFFKSSRIGHFKVLLVVYMERICGGGRWGLVQGLRGPTSAVCR